MCDICRLVTDDVDGGVFITSVPQPLCSKGRTLVAARGIRISHLSLYPEEPKNQLVFLGVGEESSSVKY
jgi:hypothetical protein